MQLPYHSTHAFPLLLAPMAGVSEAPFRQICHGMGADVVLSEFLSSEAIRRRNAIDPYVDQLLKATRA